MDWARWIDELRGILRTPAAWAAAWVVLTVVIALRYLVLGVAAECVYRFTPRAFERRRINPLPSRRRRFDEARWSLWSSALFAAAGCVIAWMWTAGYARFYYDLTWAGVPYALATWFAYAFIHDALYYFAHRLMHHPRVFKRVHAVHHRSRDPSAWASFAFHPFETVVQMSILPLLLAIIPIHPYVFLAHLILMSVTAATNHSGFEVLPRGRVGHALAGVVVSGAHHLRHHRAGTTNFGLFFTWWDHWLGTEHPAHPADRARLRRPSRNEKDSAPASSIVGDLGHT